jgi:hypothetical protein
MNEQFIISEHRLQSDVVNHIRVAGKPDVIAVALANAARRSYRLGARMKAEGLTPGAADLLIMLPQGRCGWLEMKTIKGRQSIEQKGFQARCLRLGHPYALARTFDEAIKVLHSWGALK